MLLASTDQSSDAEQETLRDFEPLTRPEARRLTDEAFEVAQELDARLLVLYRRLAWKALGYNNWGDYYIGEWSAKGRNVKKSQAYAIISYAAEKQAIADRNSDSEMSEWVRSLPDSHIAALARYPVAVLPAIVKCVQPPSQ